jgi:hypothetical protein
MKKHGSELLPALQWPPGSSDDVDPLDRDDLIVEAREDGPFSMP